MSVFIIVPRGRGTKGFANAITVCNGLQDMKEKRWDARTSNFLCSSISYRSHGVSILAESRENPPIPREKGSESYGARCRTVFGFQNDPAIYSRAWTYLVVKSGPLKVTVPQYFVLFVALKLEISFNFQENSKVLQRFVPSNVLVTF